MGGLSMASSSCSSSPPLVHCVSVFLLMIISSLLFDHSLAVTTKATPELINMICKQTDNFEFCKKTFDSNPRTETADNAGLAQITIELVLNNAAEILRKIQGLSYEETDVVMIGNLQSCKTDYEMMLNNFVEAFKFLNLKEYANVFKQEYDVVNEAVDCENLFEHSGRVSPLSDNNEIMFWLNQMALVTASLLV